MDNFYQNRLKFIHARIKKAKDESFFNENINLIAVSKMVNPKEVLSLFNAGQIAFGENKVQSLKQKEEELVDIKIDWHFIGRLQTNKINQLLLLKPKLIHSCDSLKLATEIDKRVKDFKPDILLQINSANEDTKTGVGKKEAFEIYEKIKLTCKNINLCGVMSIGAHTDDKNLIQKSFENTREVFEKIKQFDAKYCSMGMSNDFEIAIKCGSNMIRLGTIMFQ